MIRRLAMKRILLLLLPPLLCTTLIIRRAETSQVPNSNQTRPRVREAGIKVGILPPGPLNAITDVTGVLVGHTTIVRGESIRTGVTAILPHSGNLFREKVPGAVFVGNGFGKLMGSTQVNELGEIETPILLTSTLSVPQVADAVLGYMLALPANQDVQSVNALVAETNDGYLNDIRGRHITPDDVLSAIKNARGGAVEEGAIGAGTGTVAFGFKGGIGVLTINGAPVGQELGRYYLQNELAQTGQSSARDTNPDGSVIIVVATDAPLDSRNLLRMAARTMAGLGRTGSAGSNGSGDYAIAFSTAPENRIVALSQAQRNIPRERKSLHNDAMSPLFLAVIEATEEAIYNSLFKARTTTGKGHTVEALPLDRTIEILRKHGLMTVGP
jgi:D-aminopeptidase